jgi:CRISPR-associated endonuclease/helicase Cas3
MSAMDRPRRDDLRRLQQYTVPVPRNARDAWLAAGVLQPVHPSLGEALLRFDSLNNYDPDTGVQLDPAQRTAEQNII